MSRPAMRPLVGLTFLAVLWAGVPGATAAELLELEYQVYVGGLHGLTVNAQVTLPATAQRDYTLTATADTVRLLGRLLPYHLDARSEGQAEAASVVAQRFEYAQDRRGKTESVRVAYHGDGLPDLKVIRNEEDKTVDARKRVPERMMRDTLDPGSAIIALVRGVAAQGACGGTLRVFDGRRRYDVELNPSGTQTLEPSRYAMYEGEAVRCRLAIKPLAGFKSSTQPGSLPTTAVVWLARVVDGAPAVPVRVEAIVKIGGVRVYLTRARLVRDATVETAG